MIYAILMSLILIKEIRNVNNSISYFSRPIEISPLNIVLEYIQILK